MSGSTFITSLTQPSICEAIAIDDRAKIVELVVRRGHHGFPDAAFLMFAVAHDAEDAMGFAALSGGESAADGDAESLAERAAGNFHARELQAIGMAFEAGAEAPERNCILERKIAGAAERNVERWGFVTGGPENAVALRPRWICGVMIQHVEVESGGNVHDG